MFEIAFINLSESKYTNFHVSFFTEIHDFFQFLSKLGPAEMAGEIGVIFNAPQPFTVRTRRLSQVIRISHHDFKQMVQAHNEDGKTIISNFIQVWKIVMCPVRKQYHSYNLMVKLKNIRHHITYVQKNYVSLEMSAWGLKQLKKPFSKHMKVCFGIYTADESWWIMSRMSSISAPAFCFKISLVDGKSIVSFLPEILITLWYQMYLFLPTPPLSIWRA